MIMNEVNWDYADGSEVKINKKWYTDFTSSIFCQNFGHSNPYVIRELDKQIYKCLHAYGYNTKIKNKYIDKLKEFIGYSNILFFSSGTEATEAAIKICNYNKYNCVGINGSMHGRTLGAEALSGKRMAYNIDSQEIISKFGYTNKAFFIEGYRGYDCKLVDKDDIAWLKGIKIEDERDILIVFDEIQSGFYRTNKIFIHQYYDIKPDILLIGKSMGGGLPLSAVCYNKDFNLEGIELTSTHSGQPLQMAAGYGILKYIDKKFDSKKYKNNILSMDTFFNSLKVEHNNLGMVGAIKVNNEDDFYNSCYEDGLLVTKTGKGWIKIAPPVVIDNKQLINGLDILRKYAN